MKINMKVGFIIAVLLHAILLGVLLIRVNLDKPTRPNMGQGDIMHATFVPPAKGNPNGKAQQKKAAPPVVDTAAEEAAKEAQKQEMQKEIEQKLEQQRQAQIQEQQRQQEASTKKAPEIALNICKLSLQLLLGIFVLFLL